MRRVPSSERTKEAIRKVVEEGTDGDPKAALVKLGIQRVIEEALEAAVRGRRKGTGSLCWLSIPPGER